MFCAGEWSLEVVFTSNLQSILTEYVAVYILAGAALLSVLALLAFVAFAVRRCMR
jgi:hypothetical protein